MNSADYDKPSVETVREALATISPSICYADWLRIGMALHSWDSSAGLALFVEWSRGGSSFKAGEPETKWSSFKAGGVTVATLFAAAKAAGWRRSSAPRLPAPGRSPRRRQRFQIRTLSAAEVFGYTSPPDVAEQSKIRTLSAAAAMQCSSDQ